MGETHTGPPSCMRACMCLCPLSNHPPLFLLSCVGAYVGVLAGRRLANTSHPSSRTAPDGGWRLVRDGISGATVAHTHTGAEAHQRTRLGTHYHHQPPIHTSPSQGDQKKKSQPPANLVLHPARCAPLVWDGTASQISSAIPASQKLSSSPACLAEQPPPPPPPLLQRFHACCMACICRKPQQPCRRLKRAISLPCLARDSNPGIPNYQGTP